MSDPTETLPAKVETAPIVRAAGDVSAALKEYKQVQRDLDAAMPDCLITIQGKKYRRKSYWRAVATAFNLDVNLHTEELIERGGQYGYIVTYIATAPNGRTTMGDGSCDSTEKSGLHNIRANAHTRAYNRAVSNLVGFGEVSADEMQQGAGAGEWEVPGQAPQEPPPAQSRSRVSHPRPMGVGEPTPLTESQARLLYMRMCEKARAAGIPDGDVREMARQKLKDIAACMGLDAIRAIPMARVDDALKRIDALGPGAFVGEPPEEPERQVAVNEEAAELAFD